MLPALWFICHAYGNHRGLYRRRWQIESLFEQIKQNFPLRYYYGESANAIKIQIWVTMITNLLLSLLQSSLERRWNFSGLATMARIIMMEYLNMDTFSIITVR